MISLLRVKKRELKSKLYSIRKNIFKRTNFHAINIKIYKPKINLSQTQLTLLSYFTTFIFLAMIFGSVLVVMIFAFISRSLPDPNQLLERSYELSTKIFDRNSKPIYEVYGEKNRTLVKLNEISPYVVNATLATEDADFYAHKGYSLRGMMRAVKNTITGRGLQGGSTLTQQVIKNTLLTQERTVTRKIKELILSLQLENRYSKEEILQMYINESPYGGQNYGIYTAAKAYFNKHPNDLTLAESAYLAGLPQRPSYYSQFGTNPEAGIERKDTVLYLMYDRGWQGPEGKRLFINKEDYEKAKSEQLVFQSSSIPFNAPHFIFYVKQKLIDMFGEEFVEQGGLQVKTTLDLEIQEKAQEIVYTEIEGSKNLNVYNGSLIAIDPKTGQIIAMVGSKGYFLKSEPENCISGITGENSCFFEPELNVVLANRQPGSAIKPITYATMLSKGYPASYVLLDVPTKFPGESAQKPYVPENYDGIFRGPMSLRRSLGNSLNIPAVKALKIVGIGDMIDMAERMGISTFKDRTRYGLALTLGGGETKLLELAGAFGTFANKGTFQSPTPFLEIKDSNGNLLYTYNDGLGKKVLSEEVAFLISDILSDDGARSAVFGLGSMLNIPNHQVAVKTGTTDDKRDNYAFGFTPSVVVGVWVGNNNNEAMNPYIASGITGATPIWRDFMKYYLEKYFKDNPEKFNAPESVKKITVDSLTGMLPNKDGGTRMEWFIKGTEPSSVSNWYLNYEVCEADGLIANESCKNADKTDTRTYIAIKAELPEWQMYVDKWVSENYSGDEKYFPPRIKSCLKYDDGELDKDNICVEIAGFKDGDRVPLDFRLSVEVSSGRDIKSVKVYMDGQRMTEDESSPWGYNFELSAGDIGMHEFEVVAENERGEKADKRVKLEVVGYQLN